VGPDDGGTGRTSETLVYYETTGVVFQKAVVFTLAAVRTSNLTPIINVIETR
jgi:hypothetical protein